MFHLYSLERGESIAHAVTATASLLCTQAKSRQVLRMQHHPNKPGRNPEMGFIYSFSMPAKARPETHCSKLGRAHHSTLPGCWRWLTHSAQPHNHLDYNPNLLLSFLFIFPEGVSLWQSTKLCRWMWENPTDQYKLGISCLQLPCCAVSLIILVALFPITFIFFTSLLG